MQVHLLCLWRNIRLFVFRLAFRLLCDEEEARDMVQETFLRVWLSLDEVPAGIPFLHLALQGSM